MMVPAAPAAVRIAWAVLAPVERETITAAKVAFSAQDGPGIASGSLLCVRCPKGLILAPQVTWLRKSLHRAGVQD
jgi:hypothetical protein